MAVQKGSLSHSLLTALEKAVDGYVRIEDYMYHPSEYTYGRGFDRPLKKSELAQVIKRLREKGLIDFIDTDKLAVKITHLGKEAIGVETQSNWDGKYRVVIFDIPEEKRVIRNAFRRKIKHWGFKKIQQSVWVSKNDVTEKLSQTIKSLGVEEWIVILETDKVIPEINLFEKNI